MNKIFLETQRWCYNYRNIFNYITYSIAGIVIMQSFANDKWSYLKGIFPRRKCQGKSSFFMNNDNENIIKILLSFQFLL